MDSARIVQRAADGQAAAIEDVGVDHRRSHVFVTEQLLHGACGRCASVVVAVLQQVGGKRMPEDVRSDVLFDPGRPSRRPDSLLQAALRQRAAVDTYPTGGR